ncbi:Na+/H+ antiporter NhaA [Sphingobium sp. WCS2017Hpa-17]|uniref:Na+/H+ antiporter NhaA n=1 Tax=Sphingobium sp. WCS2017Hpa-17 TaxID=3073638 RepID=UPI00288AEF39|nr:Na+/H+ antiporter NhaA [Sphingobium sp. WCS2017Hpa-17]
MAITPRQKGATTARRQHAPARAKFLDRIEPFFAGKDVIGGPLLLATIAALLFTNSPLRESYERFWDTQLHFGFGRQLVSHSLAEWIDHALLPLFFIIIGADVKRELVRGALSQMRTAIFPVAGAIGGMLVPVCLFWLIARNSAAMTGWGTVITMDTAFGLALIGLFATRLPDGVRALFLAFAAIDDIGGLLVIAAAYSDAIYLDGLLIAAIGFAAIYLLRHLRWGASIPYVLLAILLWVGILKSGIHTTIAGVLLGFLVPVYPRLGRNDFADNVQDEIDEFQLAHRHALGEGEGADATRSEKKAQERLGYLDEMTRATHATGERVIMLLSPWISYVVLPLFALSNVRVHISPDLITDSFHSTFAPAILIGLCLGKPLGFLSFSWIATRLGLARLPDNVRWPMIAAIGSLAGIGFTISLFISGLAFSDGRLQEIASLAIIIASALAGLTGYAALRLAARLSI